MNIVFVSSEFPATQYDSTGGIGTYLLNITNALRDKGHNIFVITTKKTKSNQFKNIHLINLNCNIGLKAKKGTFLYKIISFIEYPLLFSIKACIELIKLIKSKKIDIIEGNDFGGELFLFTMVPFFKKPPVVIRLHTPYFLISVYNKENSGLLYKFMEFIEKKTIKKADSVYSPSKSLAKILSKEVGIVLPTVIPYPFLLEKDTKISIKRERNTVLYVGKMQLKKGILTLLKAVSYLKERNKQIRCVFIGPDTEYKGKSVVSIVINQAKKLNILNNITILGNIEKRNLEKYYKTASVLCVPSLWENFPNVVLEAFKYHIPIVANYSGGLKEMIIDGYNGLLYKKNNVKSLADKLNKIVENNNLGLKLTDNGLKSLKKKYNPKLIVRNTVDYYEAVKKRKNEQFETL